MGATLVLYTSAAPLGCYPYILTALATDDVSAYDGQGCLKAVNDIAVKFNTKLILSILALNAEFPKVRIFPTDYYATMTAQIKLKTPLIGKSSTFSNPVPEKRINAENYKFNCLINFSIIVSFLLLVTCFLCC